MNNTQKVQDKLKSFIRKYYINALIKGGILFFVLGLLYLFFTLFIEYTLWLKPVARTTLFAIFILIEGLLLFFFIATPILKLMGLKNGINKEQASKIIGKHFNNVSDKLLNLVQLQQDPDQTELLLASIEQKAKGLESIKFSKAINFKKNLVYSKYILIPVILVLLVLLSGKLNPFKQSFDRVVHYQKSYTPPAPFIFKILNKELKVIEGQDLQLNIVTVGNLTPEQVQIVIGNQTYYLKNDNLGEFSFLFENLMSDFSFSLKSNGVTSTTYDVDVLKRPTVVGFKMHMNYPSYTRRQDEDINNTGNLTVPEGTIVKWDLQAKQTNVLEFKNKTIVEKFNSSDNLNFTLTKKLSRTLEYQITTSNKDLKHFEKLSYTIVVVKDEFPKISVTSDLDSISFGPAQFAGQLSDDYGLSKLELVYFNVEMPKELQHHILPVKNTIFDTFYFLLDPEDKSLNLKKGMTYKFYFKVYDNDAVNGSKFTKSRTFEYYNKTDLELANATLNAQKSSMNDLQNDKKSVIKLEDDIKKITEKLKNQPNFKWDDVKQIKDLIARRKKEQDLINNHINNLQKNLNANPNKPKNENIESHKEALNKRIEEAKELLKQEKILDELIKLAEKLDKEGLLKRLDKFNQQSKQNKRTLERILELTKRFYIEKKLINLSQDIKELSKEQDTLVGSKENTDFNQDKINKQFKKIRKSLEQLKEDNKSLSKPMDLPNTKRDEFEINDALKKAKQSLQKGNIKEAISKQKSASKKMKQMAQKMQQSMQSAGGQMNEENMLTLQTILDNLIIFSLDQEALMKDFNMVDDNHPEFSKKLRNQQMLKNYFEHIDDSLYTLSLRMPRLSVKIQDEIVDTHYNIDEALKNLADNKINRGQSNQQYAMTASNNLALLLSNMLDQMMNPPPSKGQGKDGEKQSLSLPDIIKEQSKMMQKVKEGLKKGKNGEGNKESLSGEQYDIFKQQEALKQALNELLREAGKSGSQGNKAKKLMDDLQLELLNKGFTNSVLKKMTDLQHELLKLDKAKLKQGDDKKREATTNKKQFNNRIIKALKFKKDTYNKSEILNRKPLLLKLPYQKRVQQYFKDSI